MTLGERISDARHNKGLTQEELAEKVGISRQSIYKYEADLTEPRLLIITCISDVLGVSIDYLARGRNK